MSQVRLLFSVRSIELGFLYVYCCCVAVCIDALFQLLSGSPVATPKDGFELFSIDVLDGLYHGLQSLVSH